MEHKVPSDTELVVRRILSLAGLRVATLPTFGQESDGVYFPRRRLRRRFFCKLKGLSIFARSPARRSRLRLGIAERRRHFLLHAHV